MRIIRPASVRFVDLRSKNDRIKLLLINLFSLGTALTPTLFFDTFSTLPTRSDIREKLPVRDLKTFLAPRVVILF